jgi:hypothetical protein
LQAEIVHNALSTLHTLYGTLEGLQWRQQSNIKYSIQIQSVAFSAAAMHSTFKLNSTVKKVSIAVNWLKKSREVQVEKEEVFCVE